MGRRRLAETPFKPFPKAACRVRSRRSAFYFCQFFDPSISPLSLYEETILPAALANIKSAQAAYITARIPFLTLIEAQRGLVDLKHRYHEAVAEYFRRLATLERAAGGRVTGE
jgi:hypothetical protein